MIEKIIGATIVPDIQALGWADQIGWVVKPWTKRIETGEGQFSDIVIPVASNAISEACDIQDYGMHVLTTDKSMDILIHIGREGDMASEVAPNIAQRRALNIEQDIQISVWMNNHQGRQHLLKAALMKAFFNAEYSQQSITWTINGVTDSAYTLYLNKLKVKFIRELSNNPFSQYSFANDQAQFNHNYAAFGLVFNLQALVFPACFPVYPDLADMDCDVDFNNAFTVVIAENENNTDLCIGGELLLEGVVTGGIGTTAYQWQKLVGATWTNIPGETAINFDETIIAPERTESYRLRVTKLGVIVYSNTLVIDYHIQPELSTSIDDSTISLIQTATISSEVIGGSGGNNYQWQYFDDGDWANIVGATGSELTVLGSDYGIGSHLFRLHVIQASSTCDVYGNAETITISA